MRLEESIDIHCPSGPLYKLLSDLESHADLLPGYRESKIVERRPESCIVQREAMIHGKMRRWKSEVWLDPERAIRFRQVEGPLEGMRIEWRLEPAGAYTSLKIIHDVQVKPRWKAWWFERWVAKPAIEQTAHNVLVALKSAAEHRSLS